MTELQQDVTVLPILEKMLVLTNVMMFQSAVDLDFRLQLWL